MADKPNEKKAEQTEIVAAPADSAVAVEVPPEVAVHDRIMDAYYGKMGEEFMRKTQERVHWVCGSVRGERILDVGCSQGIVPILLGREGKQVVGLDTDAEAIAVAEAHMAAGPAHVREYVRFVTADFMGYDFGGQSFDTVIMSEILEHLVDPGAFVAHAARLLVDGGTLVVTLPFGINDFIDHKRTYYLVEAYELLARFFEISEVELFGKWIGFRCARRSKVVGAEVARAIPFDVLVATEKAFNALERTLVENLKKSQLQLKAANERVKDISQKLSNATAGASKAANESAAAAAKLAVLEARHAATVESGKSSAVDREANLARIEKLTREVESQKAERDAALAKVRAAEEALDRERESAARRLGELEAESLRGRDEVTTKLGAAEARLEHERKAAADLRADLERQRDGLAAKLHAAEEQLREREENAKALGALAEKREHERDDVAARLRATEERLRQELEANERALRELEARHAEEREDAASLLHEAQGRLEQQREAAANERREFQLCLERERDAATRQMGELKGSLERERALVARELADKKKRLAENEKSRAELARMEQRLQKAAATMAHYKSRLANDYAQLEFVRTTIAFQLGCILTYAFRSPTNFLKTPVRLARLARAALFRDSSKRPAPVFVPDIPLARITIDATPGKPVPDAPVVAARSATARATPATGASVPVAAASQPPTATTQTPPGAGISALGWPECVPNGKPVVMAVMDEFTTGCFENDVALVLPRPDNWRVLAERSRPELFFIESAWKGNGGSWQYRVAEYATRPGEEIADMALYASEHSIPLVFWNKEDPVHHQKFMVTARMADHIFTTDANMRDSYREKTGNASVHALPFAAQPALHYPAVLEGRHAQSCFAGSWYGDRHEKRGESMRWLLRAANRHGLVIYDRNHGSGNFTFPEEYQGAIKGGLPYKELCAEYRRYRVFLNVNSVTDSPTMFSRRVFELMACGTPVVSTFARGIEELFESKAVWLVDSEEQADEAIRTLLSDDAEWRRRSLAGIRDVFANHTYAHRLNQVFGQVGLATRLPVDPRVLLLALAADDGEVERLIEIARAQRYPALALRIGAPVGESRRVQLGTTEVEIVPAARLTSAGFDVGAKAIGWISARASYGPGYVRDLANAMKYRPEAHGWGKALEQDAFAFGQSGQLQSSIWLPGQFARDLTPGALARQLSNEHLFIADQAEYAPEGMQVQILEK